ncbi:MAG: hypothetical protein MZV49_16620 [Rhodopseudomonas palustris]|nr:hypothetical protein [Rhodopseudomonas palustris]
MVVIVLGTFRMAVTLLDSDSSTKTQPVAESTTQPLPAPVEEAAPAAPTAPVAPAQPSLTSPTPIDRQSSSFSPPSEPARTGAAAGARYHRLDLGRAARRPRGAAAHAGQAGVDPGRRKTAGRNRRSCSCAMLRSRVIPTPPMRSACAMPKGAACR